MNQRALKLKKQEVKIAKRKAGSALAQIAERKANLEQKISSIKEKNKVLFSLTKGPSEQSSVKNLVRLLEYRSWCDQLLEQAEHHHEALIERASQEQERLELAVRELKQLRDKEDLFSGLLARDLRRELANIRAAEEFALEELAMSVFIKEAV